MRERQYTNPLDALSESISGSGTPDGDDVMEAARAQMDRMVAAADDAYNRLQAHDTDEFLRQSWQLGGQ